MLDDLQPDAMLLRGFGGVLSGIALVDIGQFHALARHLLHLFGQRSDLGAISLIGRRHLQRQQVPQRIDRDVDLGALASLGPIITGASKHPASIQRRIC